MAIRYMDGYETLPVLKASQVISSGTAASVTGRDGVGKALSCTGGAVTSTHTTTLPAAYSTLIFGVGKNVGAGAFGSSAGGSHLWSLYGDSGATQHLTLMVDATGHLVLRRGSVSGTVLATSTNSITAGSWVYLVTKATINDTTGTCEVRIGGTSTGWINFTGDTKNAGTNSTLDTIIQGIGVALIASDDLVVCDSVDGTGLTPAQDAAWNDFFTDKVIKGIRPDGNGATSQWTGSDGNSTDNYLQVDEDPLNTSDYNGDATATNRDLYTFSDLSILGTVHAVQPHLYAQKSDGGTRQVKSLARSNGGTVSASAALNLSTTWGIVSDTIRPLDADGTAWTVTTVNNHQFGVETV